MSRFPQVSVTYRDKLSRLPKGVDRQTDNNRLIDDNATKITRAWNIVSQNYGSKLAKHETSMSNSCRYNSPLKT